MIKYADLLTDWLVEEGYTHCFFVGGGNVMHLLESARTRMKCVPVVHEVAAAIAAEYFNETGRDCNQRAYALVTAGPGITNLVTGVAGAWLESRELLIVAGQARTDALSRGKVRQIGHQEVDGAGIMRPISKLAETIERPLNRQELHDRVVLSASGRPGPVFLEMCLDVSGKVVDPTQLNLKITNKNDLNLDFSLPQNFKNEFVNSRRPLLLLGGGVDRNWVQSNLHKFEKFGIPVATTWNGADRFPNMHPLYAGRSNTYGMRWSNVVLQQSDFLIAIGTRLGLQQTGFNWQNYVPVGKITQVDIDLGELEKESPRKDFSFNTNAQLFLEKLLDLTPSQINIQPWREFVKDVETKLPVVETANESRAECIEAFSFVHCLEAATRDDDQIIPCSSGGAFTTMMQGYYLKGDQIMITDKGLASMGYGLSGAIGACLAKPNLRTILVEGDGGFAQNMQELGTVDVNRLNLKIFLFSNAGYASIRTTQKAYFNGNYVGCDRTTGLGFPDWTKLFEAFNIPVVTMGQGYFENSRVSELFEKQGPAAFIVTLDPEQIFYPKITSRILANGQMESNPIHLMTPPLSEELAEIVYKYLPENLRT